MNSLTQSDLNEKGVCSATYLVSCFSKPRALKNVFLLGPWRRLSGISIFCISIENWIQIPSGQVKAGNVFIHL